MIPIFFLATSLQRSVLPMGETSFRNLAHAGIDTTLPCWLVTCSTSESAVLPPIRAKVFEIDPATKVRKVVLEQQTFGAPVAEQLDYKGQAYRFLYPQSNGSDFAIFGSSVLGPLTKGANYLVWSCPFDGTSSKGTFLQSADVEYIYNLPAWLRSGNLRMATGRIRTVSTVQPKNLKEQIEGVLQAIAVGGQDAEFEVMLLQSADPSGTDSKDFVFNDLPKEAMRLRNQSQSVSTRAIYSYLAQYFGGSGYTKTWLDDVAQVSFNEKNLNETSGLKAISPSRIIDIQLGLFLESKAMRMAGNYHEFTEPNDDAIARFGKTKDDQARQILVRYLRNPNNQIDAEKWVPILVHSTGETWEKSLAAKLSNWLNNPKLAPTGGITMDGLRQRYREIYNIS